MTVTWKKILLEQDPPTTHNLASAIHPDVNIASPVNGQMLIYDAATAKWVNLDPNVTVIAQPSALFLHDRKIYKTAVFDASASGDLVAAVAAKVIKLHALTIQAQGEVVVNLNNGSAGASLMEWVLQAREGVVVPMANAPAYWAKTGVNTALYVTLSTAIVVTITAIYSDDEAS